MTTKAAADDFVRSLTEAWNSHDPTRMSAFYTDGATLLDPFYAEPLVGQSAIERDAADLVTAFQDVTFRPTMVIANGATVVVEVLISGTNTGPAQLPAGPLPPTNRRVEFSAASVFDLDEMGKIREERRYFDVFGLLAQLGLTQ
jgi:steroid delta-isomerase-like uncharacterized protein